GLMTAQVARLAGAGTGVLVEPDGARRAPGLAPGGDAAIAPAETNPAAIAAAGGRRGGFDVAIEASGHPDALASAMTALAAGGRLGVVSIFDAASVVAIAPYLLYEKEIQLTGAHATAHTFPRALQLLHRLDLGPLITSV